MTLRKYSWLSFETICRVAGHKFSLPPGVIAECDCTKEGTAGMVVGLSVASPVTYTPREGTRCILGLVCISRKKEGPPGAHVTPGTGDTFLENVTEI